MREQPSCARRRWRPQGVVWVLLELDRPERLQLQPRVRVLATSSVKARVFLTAVGADRLLTNSSYEIGASSGRAAGRVGGGGRVCCRGGGRRRDEEEVDVVLRRIVVALVVDPISPTASSTSQLSESGAPASFPRMCLVKLPAKTKEMQYSSSISTHRHQPRGTQSPSCSASIARRRAQRRHRRRPPPTPRGPARAVSAAAARVRAPARAPGPVRAPPLPRTPRRAPPSSCPWVVPSSGPWRLSSAPKRPQRHHTRVPSAWDPWDRPGRAHAGGADTVSRPLRRARGAGLANFSSIELCEVGARRGSSRPHVGVARGHARAHDDPALSRLLAPGLSHCRAGADQFDRKTHALSLARVTTRPARRPEHEGPTTARSAGERVPEECRDYGPGSSGKA